MIISHAHSSFHKDCVLTDSPEVNEARISSRVADSQVGTKRGVQKAKNSLFSGIPEMKVNPVKTYEDKCLCSLVESEKPFTYPFFPGIPRIHITDSGIPSFILLPVVQLRLEID
ncbi:hypothetical protein CEXT_294291 [Caerostris extrusa]|uniref:Uncharacterized protein n=1 Tax=Caerostris extrusa TaxID=172846 RepID=A0AAV4U913_CAEEX|nr:hypothetical protein CEXT_294291 [Caerostris extrusa]